MSYSEDISENVFCVGLFRTQMTTMKMSKIYNGFNLIKSKKLKNPLKF